MNITPKTPEQLAEEKLFKDRRHQQEVQDLRKNWNAPVRHAQRCPEMVSEWGVVFEKLKALIEPSKGRTIALVGGRGSGKTQMAVEAMKFKTNLLKSALFTTSVDLITEFQDCMGPKAVCTRMEVIRKYREQNLLVLDESGKRGETVWENSVIFGLLNHRYNDLTDTIIIDNRAPEEFMASIGDSLVSRISEGGAIFDFKWETFRDSALDPMDAPAGAGKSSSKPPLNL